MSTYIGNTLIAGKTDNKITIPLLTHLWSDHILNDINYLMSDNFSWQSGDAYSAVYEHLLYDLSSATLTTGEYQSNNIDYNANIYNSKGVIRGFKANNGADITALPTSTANSLEMVVKIYLNSTGTNVIVGNTTDTAPGGGFVIRTNSNNRLYIWGTTNGTSWTTSQFDTGLDIAIGVNYIKIVGDGSTYTVSTSVNGSDWTDGNVLTSENFVDFVSKTVLGNSLSKFLDGTIDLNECYVNINGERFWTGCNYYPNYYKATDGHRIVYTESEEKINQMYNELGSAWYYILDVENKRFKLPRDKNRRLIQSWKEGTEWYEVYSDGWCRQGGYLAQDSGTDSIYVSFPKEFSGIDYELYTTGVSNRAMVSENRKKEMRTTKGLYVSFYGDYGTSSTSYYGVWWMAEGYLNISEYESQVKNYLYFYVGQFSQPAIYQTAGLNAELLNSKVDTDAIDGPWVNKNYTVFTSVTFTEDQVVEYDLSQYLPNDNNNYEVIVSCYGRTGKTSGNACGSSVYTSVITTAIRLGRAVTRTSNDADYSGTGIIVVGTDRKITYRNMDSSGTSGVCGLFCNAYRRLGKGAK